MKTKSWLTALALAGLWGCASKDNPATPAETGVVYQSHLGSNYNPVDIEFSSDSKAYVSLENRPYLLIINPQTGDSIGSINFSAYIYAPDTGLAPVSPNTDQMILNGGKLYVSVQRRNGWSVVANGLIVVVDVSQNSVTDTVLLAHPNPSKLVINGNKLFVACQGDAFGGFGIGAIESVDLTTLQTSVLTTQTSLVGAPKDFAFKGGSVYYVLVDNSGYVGSNFVSDVQVKTVDLSTGVVTLGPSGIVDASGGIAYDTTSKRLFVGERKTGGDGILVFDENNTSVGSPIHMNLPPYSMAVSGSRLFIILSDYTSGVLRWINLGNASLNGGSLTVFQDSKVRAFAGFAYVLEGLGGDNIIKFDASLVE